MQNSTDRQYLRDDQYRTPSNLDARLALHARFSTNHVGWHRWLFEQMDLPAGARVLECGCGPGTLWSENLEQLPSGLRLTLTDLSAGMVRTASAALSSSGTVDFAGVADVQSLPFVDGTFDIVVANHMLYHVPDRPRAFSEIARVLKPGGQLWAATNGLGHMAELFDLAEEFGSVDRGTPSHAAFSLENGGDQLAAYFASVDLALYPDSLRVTDPDALIAYLQSGFVNSDASTTGWREVLAARIERGGAVEITKSVGVFVARKK